MEASGDFVFTEGYRQSKVLAASRRRIFDLDLRGVEITKIVQRFHMETESRRVYLDYATLDS